MSRHAQRFRRAFLLRSLALCLAFASTPSGARAESLARPAAAQKPGFYIESVTVPANIAREAELRKYLERALKQASKKVDFGMGPKGRVEARFVLTNLSYRTEGSVLSVHGALTGKLPSGRHAESTIQFGGRIADEAKLTKQVLDILARGVMTRLAELERRRRGL